MILGISDEYASIWAGEPGASERIGDMVVRPDGETYEVTFEKLYLYVAAHDVPDYHASPASMKSAHLTLEGAIESLYPDRPDFRKAFRLEGSDRWIGPDGFGSVRRVEVQP